MLNHRNTSILFVVILVALNGLNMAYSIHWLWFVMATMIFGSIEFYGAYFVHSNFHIKAICKVETDKKHVALTFDDGPMEGRTQKVLDVLQKHNVKASFFCIGKHIEGNEAILKNIDKQGHLIGNHSYVHSNMYDFNTTKQFVTDMQLASDEIKKVIGKKPMFFRPPYGVTTPGLARACKKLKFNVIGWNVRSLDTTIKDKEELLERVTKRIKPGSIILFHDTVDGIDIVLEELLNYLKQNNYKVVELDKLIHKKAYA